LSRATIWVLSLLAIASILLWTSLKFEQLRLTRFMQVQLASKTAELDRQLDRLAVLPRVLSAHPDVIQVLQKTTQTSHESANQSLLQAQISSRASFAFVMDSTGTTVASSNYLDEVSFVGKNYGFRPYFHEAMESKQATFFAVGATTGIPGYFVAHAVRHGAELKGVVVVKAELAGLFDAWRLAPYEWVALDEFGVAILSTRNDFLYSATRELSDSEVQKINNDRRYIPATSSQLILKPNTRASSLQGDQSWFVQSRSLSNEKWQLLLVIEQYWVWLRALYYVLALGSVLTIIALIYRNLLIQKRLAATEHRHAHELEIEVEERTKQLRATQEELIAESNFAVLGRMSAAINHEVNQPLASLRLNLASLRKVLDQPNTDPAEIRQIVVDSDRTTKRIGRVVTTLRSLAGSKKTVFTNVRIDNLIADVVETVKRERPEMSKALKVSSSDTQVEVLGDEILLQQLLLNLLYNAFDAVLTIDDPKVTLKVSRQLQNVSLDIADNGRGVSEAVKLTLFKPFSSDKSKASGLGLGLTLAKMIADEHKASLNYNPLKDEENTQSTGSVFTFTIPLADESRV